MAKYNSDEKGHRPFWAALVFEKDGDLNLTWLFVFLMGLVGSFGFVWTVMVNAHSSVITQIAAWSFLGGSFMAVLIAAIPIAKAKVLANSKVVSDFAHSIASVGANVETSTDIKELSQKQQTQSNDLG